MLPVSISRIFKFKFGGCDEKGQKSHQINLEVYVISFIFLLRTCLLRSVSMPLLMFTVHLANQTVFYLFSEEQKNETQGLMLFLSEDGGRYIASEKQVISSFSSSVLMEQTWINSQQWTCPRPVCTSSGRLYTSVFFSFF